MKTISCITTLLFLITLFSCSKEVTAPIESFSADKKMKVSIRGSRANVLDSWMLEIELIHAGTSSKVVQEFYADEVSKKNVVFEWKSDRLCIIQLTQRDGVVIHVPIKVVE